MNVLLTGATGFVGSSIIKKILNYSNYKLIVVSRQPILGFCEQIKSLIVESININSDWKPALNGIDVVVHSAARVHIMQDSVSNPLYEFRKVNTEGTLNLARQAAESGVRRFIFISSIKVNGEGTLLGKPFSANNAVAPVGSYGISKYEAELGLIKLGEETGLEIVIVRPVLVYGPGVKANFLSMMHWLNKGVPLPFGAINNKRSLVALDNLVDLIVTCIDHPAAANQTFLVSDDEDMSTTELLQRMAVALGKAARLLPVSEGILRVGATLLGKKEVAQRLLGSLQVDIGKTKEILGWQPPISVDEALKKTAKDFLARQQL